ncbi:MAG: hypothetical protein GTN74_01395 [Proteobacteria bacterium]|nr:hypothetical protein [Pseudomonadota bacterium]NIS67767.1 hypothetical protein [Pseudomonadota bacterium]
MKQGGGVFEGRKIVIRLTQWVVKGVFQQTIPAAIRPWQDLIPECRASFLGAYFAEADPQCHGLWGCMTAERFEVSRE